MDPTPDSFHALARSSPWRWTTLHFTHRRSDPAGSVEAWVRRPDDLLVRSESGEEHRLRGESSASGTVVVTATSTGLPDRYVDPPGPPAPAPDAPPAAPSGAVLPTLRPDGLVARRPGGDSFAEVSRCDGVYWHNYSWVAMLDPVELSHHVEVVGAREDEVHGRPVWRAELTPVLGYEPRCGGNCCELLWSEAGLLADFNGDRSRVPEHWRGRTYPTAYDVALDLQTGVVVRCHPVGEHPDAPWLEVDIHDVDADLDHLFDGA